MERNLVSVIIPTFNRSQFIAGAIDSVIGQRYGNLEILVVDDGSTDSTSRVVGLYRKRVLYFRKDNGGASSARNLGILKSQGEFVAFLDSDDLWAPEKLEKQVAAIKDGDFGFSLCDIELIDEQSHHLGYSKFRKQIPRDGFILERILRKPFCVSSFLLFKREVLDNIGVFDETLSTAEDIDILLRAAHKYRAVLVDSPLVKYRKTAHSLSTRLFTRNRLKALDKLRGYAPDLYRHHSRTITRTIARIHFQYGKDLLWRKEMGTARGELIESLKTRFSAGALLLLMKWTLLRPFHKKAPAKLE